MIIIFIIYMIIGFFFVKPHSIRNIHLTYVDYSEGFFMFAVPIWVWLIWWVLWLPFKILQLIFK